MRVCTALLLCFVTCSVVAARQAGQSQSTTNHQSSITGLATTVTPAKYYIGTINLSELARAAKEKEKSAGCKASSQGSKLKSDLKQDEPYLLGEAPILVHATASDGCPVKLTITKGDDVIKLTSSSDSDGSSAPPDSSGSTYTVTLLKPGSATIHAVEKPPKAGVSPAPPADWNLTVEENASVCIPGLLPQKPPKKAKADVSYIVQYLGNPSPYSFQVVGEKLLVYSAKECTENEKKTALEKIKKDVQDLLALAETASATAGTTAAQASTTSTAAGATGSSASGAPAGKPAYSIEISVPHYGALGDLATKLNTVNYPDFAIQDVGSSRVRITSTTLPACGELTAFLRDLRDVAWGPHPDNPVTKLFFLNASDITGALGSSASAPASSPAASSSSQTGGSAAGAPAAGTGAGKAATSPATAGGSSTTASAGASPGSGSVTSAVGGAGAGSSAGSAPSAPSGGAGTGGAGGGSSSAGAGAGSAATAGAAPTPPTVSGVGTDTLLFQDAVPGDDAAVTERKRLVALLDLPRPQMIINVWSLQTSSTDGKAVATAVREIHKEVDTYNETIQQAIGRGWAHLRDEIANPANYFDLRFYKYLTGRYAQDPIDMPRGLAAELVPQRAAQRILKRQTGSALPANLRNQWGICPEDQYCLGYKNIFQPLKPRLTDLLVATIASRAPVETMNATVNAMEGLASPPAPADCVQDDLDAAKDGHFYLECFRAVANGQFAANGSQPSPLGLLRAVLTNFLFQYKLSQMFPHEFDDYELSQSAQALNAALEPLVDAFNRDLAAYQSAFSTKVMNDRKRGSGNWAGAEKATLINNGLITVRTISGFESTVNTTSQNFLDATQMPTVSALLQSIEGARSGGTGSGSAPAASGTSSRTDLLQNISPIQAQVILGALSAYQSSKVQIGRSLNIDVTPRSLNGASSAEITVKINADESAAPTYYSPTASAASPPGADISRVASHDTTTRVRVESIKLFDVSTFTAVLQKSRTRFPLIPPLVEIPYIGTLIGVPLPVAKEFHSSMAVLSTIIVPTAADIVLGLSFKSDQLVDSNGAKECSWPGDAAGDDTARLLKCSLAEASFFSDLNSIAIKHYHKQMIACLANSMQAGSPILDSSGNPAMSSCNHLSLESSVPGPE